MSTTEFYSDRVNGPAPRDQDTLPEVTARGLLNLVQAKIDSNWFASRFPEQCYDKQGVIGTLDGAVENEIEALIPNISRPLLVNINAPNEALLDLVEYGAVRVAEPKNGIYHSGLKHHELRFNEKTGRAKFRDEVNQILARGGTTYELTPTGQIQRIGAPEVRQQLIDLRPDTGDVILDGLIVEARALYMSHRSSDRKIGLEKLWDAFERLKTIEIPGGDKKSSVARLLKHIPDEPVRTMIEDEMIALTNVGNSFNLRHHETGKHLVPKAAFDYFFSRLSNVIIVLLRHSGRLSLAPKHSDPTTER